MPELSDVIGDEILPSMIWADVITDLKQFIHLCSISHCGQRVRTQPVYIIVCPLYRAWRLLIHAKPC